MEKRKNFSTCSRKSSLLNPENRDTLFRDSFWRLPRNGDVVVVPTHGFVKGEIVPSRNRFVREVELLFPSFPYVLARLIKEKGHRVHVVLKPFLFYNTRIVLCSFPVQPRFVLRNRIGKQAWQVLPSYKHFLRKNRVPGYALFADRIMIRRSAERLAAVIKELDPGPGTVWVPALPEIGLSEKELAKNLKEKGVTNFYVLSFSSSELSATGLSERIAQ